MKVCFVIRRLDPGGAERQLVSLVKGLPKDRFDITVMEFYDGGALLPELQKIQGVKRVCLHKGNRWHLLGFLQSYIREMRRIDPDVIHGYLYVSNILAVLAKLCLRKKPKVVMGMRSSNTHLEHYDWAASFCAYLEKRLSPFADLLIANSKAGADYCTQTGYAPRKLAVVSNGIDIKQFQPDENLRREMRRQWNIQDDQVLIGLTARFDRKKNHPIFLEAAARLARENDAARFVCIGGGGRPEYVESVKQQARSLGLSEKLVWAGDTREMTKAYNALDINTLCSNAAEGFPNVLAEAMSCGVPCVATDTGDARLIIGDTGLIIPESDAALLVAAWQELLRRPASALRSRARARIVDNFSIERLAENTERELRGVAWA